MLADHAAGVLAVGAGFGAVAGGVGGEGDGACGEVDDFVAEDVGDGDFGGGDQPVVAVLQLAGDEGALVVGVEEVFGELGELAGAVEGFRVHEAGGKDLDVAVLAGVEVEHEVGEGSLEAGSGAELEDEAGAGDLGGALEVEDAEGFADLPVGTGGEVEGGDGAPGLLDDVVVLGGAGGDAVVGKVGEGLEELAKAEVGFGGAGFELVCLFFERGGLCGDEGDVGALALEAAELGGEGVALGLEGLSFGDGRATGCVEIGKSLEECPGLRRADGVFLRPAGDSPAQTLNHAYSLYFSVHSAAVKDTVGAGSGCPQGERVKFREYERFNDREVGRIEDRKGYGFEDG